MKVRIKAGYRKNRKLRYPPIEDQLDAIWKGGADEAAMRFKIKEIKDKFPKPKDK